jgi:glycosyltransferase involved in cell wall biosynthesis
MRILLVTSMVPDPGGIGAIPKLLAAELEGLSERNEVTLLTTFGEDPGQAEAAARLRDSGLEVHAVDRRRSSSALRRWWVRAELAMTWLTRRWPWRVVCGEAGVQPLLDRLVAEREFDVIAVEDNPVAVLRFPAEIPVVFTEHEATRVPAGQWRASRLRDRPLAALRARDWRRWDGFLPRAWERFDLLQVFCEADAMAVRRRAPALADRVRVNPYGMILPPATDPAREVADTVLFTGTFAHLPNREAAIWLAREIMPAVRLRRPEAKLRIVGRTPPREVLELAGTGVEIVADAASMEPHLEQAAVIVAPVRSGGGMRMKVLEAIARGKPVVTTALGAEGFTAFPGAMPFAVADEAEPFAEAIAELLGDDAGRHALGAQARDFAVRHHSPAAWAERLEAVFAEAA